MKNRLSWQFMHVFTIICALPFPSFLFFFFPHIVRLFAYRNVVTGICDNLNLEFNFSLLTIYLQQIQWQPVIMHIWMYSHNICHIHCIFIFFFFFILAHIAYTTHIINISRFCDFFAFNCIFIFFSIYMNKTSHRRHLAVIHGIYYKF